ncbi:MAG: outer membrane lipid asymmetry maintenance protein MlaD [Chromatiales bacterium]|nr:outer membrane lipid asymmetry maintenance protein MlaD [Chromatiales bacterium]
MQVQAREIGTGLFVFLGFAALLFLATQTTGLDEFFEDSGYSVTARFTEVAGLRPRAPVTMAGVTIGRVESIRFDRYRLDAVVTLRIRSEYDTIPEDSTASILTAGLLGSKYIGLTPGGADESLEEGSEIFLTQSAVVLEQLVSRFLFGGGE